LGRFAQKIVSTATTKECFEFGSTTASCIHAGCFTVLLQIANSLVDLRADSADFAL
jgi:hypothetical protein